MTRCTENQIKKLLSNPLEEHQVIDIPQESAEVRKNPHMTISKSTEKIKRDVKNSHTTSPPIKTNKAIIAKAVHLQSKLKTEKKTTETLPHAVIEVKQSSAQVVSSSAKLLENTQQEVVEQILCKVGEYQSIGPHYESFKANLDAAQDATLRVRKANERKILNDKNGSAQQRQS